MIDDILDVTQTSEKLGKSAGKDIAAQKATYPAIHGLEKSRATARRLTRAASTAGGCSQLWRTHAVGSRLQSCGGV